LTLSPAETAQRLAAHGLAPKRSLGQNFVVDPNTVRRIARLAGVGPGDRVVEIGAGLGALTRALLATGAEVTAVEIDRGLVAVLREDLVAEGVRVVEGNALTLDWAALLGTDRWTLVANLPYNVATPLVADLLDGVPQIACMLVMVQREVAERLAAHAGDDAYGAVSVKVSYWATARVAGRVPASVFLPRPKVESALVSIVRRDEPAVTDVDRERLFALVRAGFAQRRKMLRRALSGTVDPGLLPAVFAAAGIRPESRAEELSVVQWGDLARSEAAVVATGAP
jgi:16S rRNA (adenine1518-N6/adenine1519-N6)-dimethyltransferase